MIETHEVPEHDELFWNSFEVFLQKNAVELNYSDGQFSGVESTTYDYDGVDLEIVRHRDGTMEVGNDSNQG